MVREEAMGERGWWKGIRMGEGGKDRESEQIGRSEWVEASGKQRKSVFREMRGGRG